MLWPLKEDVDLSFLVGRELIQVSIGIYQVIFGFVGDLTISVEDCFEIEEPSRRITWIPEAVREAAQAVCLLGRNTEGIRRSDSVIELSFSGGYSLRIRPTNTNYESFQINNRGKLYIV